MTATPALNGVGLPPVLILSAASQPAQQGCAGLHLSQQERLMKPAITAQAAQEGAAHAKAGHAFLALLHAQTNVSQAQRTAS
jgi:hypothetical protein